MTARVMRHYGHSKKTMQPKHIYPFTAIIAQKDLKLCLLLNLVDPTIGGVLATGDKGTAKTTTVRGLSQLMGHDFPFVNLPIGATEDRVLGNINLEKLINEKVTVVDKGVLAKAHQGFLYIDEVNLLNDYLMDVLLDAAASGGYYLEREGISQWMDSRFCLVGTMNPEEGTLRPQLLDRFGLSVTIQTPQDIAIRTKIAMQGLTFDSDPEAFYKQFQEEETKVRNKVFKAQQQLVDIEIPEAVQNKCASLTIEHQVEGMRADILLLKTARAYAAFCNESTVTVEMVDTIAPFVLQHRAKDYTPPTDQDSNNGSDQNNEEDRNETSLENEANQPNFQLPKAVQKGLKFSTSKTTKKQEISLDNLPIQNTVSYSGTPQSELSIVQSVKQYMVSGKFKAIHKQAVQKATTNIIFLIDTSASMAIDAQMSYVKGVIKKTITSYPNQKIQYAMVGLHDHTAKIIQEFTTNTDRISEINYQLKIGGKTNLGAGFLKVNELLKSVRMKMTQLFVFTDGKINAGGTNSFQYAIEVYKKYLGRIPKTTIVDTETGFVKLGRAAQLSEKLQSKYLLISQF